MAKYKIALIPGDGIGPEITEATLLILNSIDLNLEFVPCKAGYSYWKETGDAISEETIDLIRELGVCLKAPTTTLSGAETYKSVAVTLRQSLDLYANIRPIKSRKGVKCLYPNLDFVIVRENTEGLYRGLECDLDDTTLGIRVITKKGSERIARFACELARSEGRRKITVVHKANILKKTDGIFRDTCEAIAMEYPNIEFEELYVDAAAMRLVMKPQEFDVILTTNMFGDILSDEAAGLTGGLGLAPSANVGDRFAMFEPAHGTGLDIAGKGIANPSSMILSSVLMLKHLGEKKEAGRLEWSLNEVLREGKTITPDLGGEAKTIEMAGEIAKKLAES